MRPAADAADDLIGWTERKNGETQRFDGILSGFDVSRTDADQMIIQARLAAGWITEEDLAAEAEPEEEGAEGAEAATPAAS